ncbi:MAG: tetratricopeptide repeat protein [Armatimonadota bacterium]
MKPYRIITILLIVALFFTLAPVNDAVTHSRLVLGLRQPTPWFQIVARGEAGDTELAVTGVTGVIVGAALGGFREVAATMLWMKTHEYWHSGKMLQAKALWLMRLVTLLDPHWMEPWRVTAWHLSYNLYVETDNPELQAKYLQMGVDCLKEGISWNPDRYDLYLELAWLYFDKVEDFEKATKWFKAAMRYPHPEYVDRLVGHAYERMPNIPRALDAYDYCLKRDPMDHTAKGATLTIRERYLRPWRLMEQGKYDEALEAINEYLTVQPKSTLGLHMKAHIAEEAGRTRLAYDTWKLAGKISALDHLAKSKAVELAHELGIPAEETPQYLYQQKVSASGKMGQTIQDREGVR